MANTNNISFDQVPQILSNLIEEFQQIKRLLSEKIAAPPPLPDLIDIQEASVLTKYKVSTIYTKKSRREIPFIKPDGTKPLRFSRNELNAWMRDGRKATKKEIDNRANDYLIRRK